MSTLSLTIDSVRRFIALFCLWGALVAVGGCFSGCTTQNTPGRILATTVQSVDTAMQEWANWVALGKATPEQEANVRALYSKYQAAESAAEAAYVAAAKLNDQSLWQQAIAALSASQRDLLSLLAKLNPPKPTP